MSYEARAAVLETAASLITGDRADQYGDAFDTHERIAEIWNAVAPVDGPLSPAHVALMMIGVKMVRAAKNPQYQDSWVDIAGYAALGAEFVGDA